MENGDNLPGRSNNESIKLNRKIEMFLKLKPENEKSTKLEYGFCFYYMRRHTSAAKHLSYEQNLKLINSFDTVEAFWRTYNHMIRPDDIPNSTDLQLFREGILPMWEVGDAFVLFTFKMEIGQSELSWWKVDDTATERNCIEVL